jgi:hypothetical protein
VLGETSRQGAMPESMARPSASSAGEVIRLPEDNLPKLLRRASLDLLRLNDVVVADEFVFTAIGIGLFFLDLIDDFHVAADPFVSGWTIYYHFKL